MSLGEQFEPVLAAARHGEEWALTAIYRDLQPRVLRYLQGKQPRDAEDLASEVWLDVATGLGRFRGEEAAFHGWVFTIARRRVLDARRQQARRRTTVVPVEALAHRAAGEDVEGEVVSDAGYKEVLGRIRALPGDQADVVLLRVVAGLSVDEVAATLGKRPGTVRVLQHRALKRLARAMGPSPVTGEEAGRFEGQDATPTP